MRYKVVFSERAFKQLAKMDKPTRVLIDGWIRRHLEGCEDPRSFGKALKANLSGAWRYRVGDYRIIAEIKDDEIVILVLEIAHRSTAYR